MHAATEGPLQEVENVCPAHHVALMPEQLPVQPPGVLAACAELDPMSTR